MRKVSNIIFTAALYFLSVVVFVGVGFLIMAENIIKWLFVRTERFFDRMMR